MTRRKAPPKALRMGTWSDSLLSSFQFWVGWIAIGGTSLGLASAVATLFARQETSTRSSSKELQRTIRIETTEKALEITRTELRLAQAEAKVARELAAKAEIAAKPKPLKERITVCLQSIDPKFIIGIRSGVREFRGDLKPWQFTDLQKICAEPGAAAYIRIRVGEVSSLTPDGLMTPVTVTILQSPLQ